MTTSPTPAQLAELEKLEQAATPGEWTVQVPDEETDEDDPATVLDFDTKSVVALCGARSEPMCWADAELIATMRNSLPSLIAAARRAGELEALLRDTSDYFSRIGLSTPARILHDRIDAALNGARDRQADLELALYREELDGLAKGGGG